MFFRCSFVAQITVCRLILTIFINFDLFLESLNFIYIFIYFLFTIIWTQIFRMRKIKNGSKDLDFIPIKKINIHIMYINHK